MYELTELDRVLMERAGHECEICKGEEDLRAFAVAPYEDEEPEHSVLLCEVCRGQLESGEFDSNHWYGLQETIWSEVGAVQVLSWQVLHQLLPETWAAELLDQAYLEEELMEWARQGLPADDEDEEPRVVDADGTPLRDGDSVTIIKDLDVKGGGFVAKRGTLVKGIKLIDDPTHIDGRVNGVGVYLKTEFLRKA